MLTPIECLEKKLSEIRVELDFTKGTKMKDKHKKLAKKYETAINTLKSIEE